MPLDGRMLYSAVRLIGDRTRDEKVGRERLPIGTGFFVIVQSKAMPSAADTYLLTAHHVVRSQTDVEVEIADPFNAGRLHPRLKTRGWCQPVEGLDLAVAPFERPDEYGALALQMDYHLVETLNVPLGADFHYVGLLGPLDRPMARSGTIGALNQEGVPLKRYEYAAHLADCRSYGGFSGSPCFAEYAFPSLTPKEPPAPLPECSGDVGRMRYLHLLCGMFTGHLTSDPDEEPEDEIDERFAAELVSRYGVGIILPSDAIWRALMTPELQKKRQENDRARLEAAEKLKPTIEEVGAADDDEFDRFEDLTRKLVQVPKPAMDEKRKG
jgi:Trypsin-like peptidase domain